MPAQAFIHVTMLVCLLHKCLCISPIWHVLFFLQSHSRSGGGAPMRKPSQQLKVIDVPTHEVSIAQYVALVMFLWHWYVFTPNPSQTVRLSASYNVQTSVQFQILCRNKCFGDWTLRSLLCMNRYFGGCYVTISLRYVHTYVHILEYYTPVVLCCIQYVTLLAFWCFTLSWPV